MRYLVCIIIILILAACRPVGIYPCLSSPIWLSNEMYKASAIDLSDFSVVTFNIKESEKIDLAIEELRAVTQFNNPDIFLLQEMDEAGVETIAKSFGMNYLYFPASIQKNGEVNFGNAVLAKAKLSHVHKLILPHKRKDNQIRIGTSCIAEVKGKQLLLYSVHLATIMVARNKRHEQMDALVADILNKASSIDAVIVGGDFNTLFEKDLRALVDKFENAGLDWQTEEVGATGSYYLNLIKPRNDHVFTSGIDFYLLVRLKMFVPVIIGR